MKRIIKYNSKLPIRLFWGENYTEKPACVRVTIQKALKATNDRLHLYPDTLYGETQAVVAKQLQIQPNQVLLGHGIEGLIHLTCQTFLNSKDAVGGMFKPSFFVFGNNLARYKQLQIPCHYDEAVDVEKLIKRIQKTQLFFLASPNTATGNYLLDMKQIESILQNYKGILAVDECYFGIGQQTVIDLVDKYANLLVYRGMTKVMGMAAARLGIAVGNAELIGKLNYQHREIELDPINSFSLHLLKNAFPYYDVLAKNTREFFDDFLTFMQKQFPHDTFRKTVTTFHFMNISRYSRKTFEIVNAMNHQGYLLAETDLSDNSTINFPEFISLTPPPKERWQDFCLCLKKALKGKVD